MTKQNLTGSYRPATAYFPERDLRNEVTAVISAVANSANNARTFAKAVRQYNEERFISRIVSRIFP